MTDRASWTCVRLAYALLRACCRCPPKSARTLGFPALVARLLHAEARRQLADIRGVTMPIGGPRRSGCQSGIRCCPSRARSIAVLGAVAAAIDDHLAAVDRRRPRRVGHAGP